jgi:hypothetical protein
MSIESDLITYLYASTALAAYTTEIELGKNSQAVTGNRISVHTIDGGEEHHLTGGAGFAKARVQLSIWAPLPVSAVEMREVLRNRLQGKGQITMGTTTIVKSVQFESGPFLYEEDESGGDAGTYHQPVDLIIYYGQTVPAST